MEQEEEHIKGPVTRRRSEVVGTPDRVLRSRTEKTEVIAQTMKRGTPQKEATPRKSLRKTVDVSTPTRRSIRGTSAQPEGSPSVKKIARGRRASSVQPESPNKEVTPPSKGKRTSMLPVAESNSTYKSRKSISSTSKSESNALPDPVKEVKRVTRRSVSSPVKDILSPARTTRRTSLLKEVKSPSTSSPESEGKRTPPNTRRQVKNLNLSPVKEAKDEKLSPKETTKMSPKNTKITTPRKSPRSDKKSPQNSNIAALSNVAELKINTIDDDSNRIISSIENSHELTDALPAGPNPVLINQDKQDSFTESEDSGIKEMEEFNTLEGKVPDLSQDLACEIYEDQNNDPNGKDTSVATNIKMDTFKSESSLTGDTDPPGKIISLVKMKSAVVLLEDCQPSDVSSNLKDIKSNLSTQNNKEILSSKQIDEDVAKANAEGLNNPIEQNSKQTNADDSGNTLTVPVVNFIAATPNSNTKSPPDSPVSKCVLKEGLSLKKSLLVRFSESPEKNADNSSGLELISFDSNNISGNRDPHNKESDRVRSEKLEESDNDLTLQLPDSDEENSPNISSQPQASDNESLGGGKKSGKITPKTSPKMLSLKAIFEKPNSVSTCISKIDFLNKSSCDSEKSLDTDDIDVSVVSEKNHDNTLKSIDSILQDSDEESSLKKEATVSLTDLKNTETSPQLKRNSEAPHLKDFSTDLEFMDVSSIHDDHHLSTVYEEDDDVIAKANVSGLVNKPVTALSKKDNDELLVNTEVETSQDTDAILTAGITKEFISKQDIIEDDGSKVNDNDVIETQCSDVNSQNNFILDKSEKIVEITKVKESNSENIENIDKACMSEVVDDDSASDVNFITEADPITTLDRSIKNPYSAEEEIQFHERVKTAMIHDGKQIENNDQPLTSTSDMSKLPTKNDVTTKNKEDLLNFSNIIKTDEFDQEAKSLCSPLSTSNLEKDKYNSSFEEASSVGNNRGVEMSLHNFVDGIESEVSDSKVKSIGDKSFFIDKEKSFVSSLVQESANLPSAVEDTRIVNNLTFTGINNSSFLDTSMPGNEDVTENQSTIVGSEKSSFLETSMPSCNSTVVRNSPKLITPITENIDEIVCSDNDSVTTEEAPSDISYRESTREPSKVIDISYDDETSDTDSVPGKLKSTVRVVTPTYSCSKASKSKEDLDKSIASLSDLIQDSDSQQENVIEEEVQTISSEESSSDESGEVLGNIFDKVEDDSENDSDYLLEEDNNKSSEGDCLDESLEENSITGKDFLADEAEEGNETSSSDETSNEDIPIMHIQQQTKEFPIPPLKNKALDCKELPQWKVKDNNLARKITKLTLNKTPSLLKKVTKAKEAGPEKVAVVGCGVKFSEISLPSDKQVVRSYTGVGVKFKILSLSEHQMQYLFNRAKTIYVCGSKFTLKNEEDYHERAEHQKRDTPLFTYGTWAVEKVDPDKIIQNSSYIFQCNSNFKVETVVPPRTLNSMNSSELKQLFSVLNFKTKPEKPSSVMKKNRMSLKSNRASNVFNITDSRLENNSREDSETSCSSTRLKGHVESTHASKTKNTRKDEKKISSAENNSTIVYIHNLWTGVNALHVKKLLNENGIDGFKKINLSLCSTFDFLEYRGYASIDFESRCDAQKCLRQCSQGLFFKGRKLIISSSKDV